jgi:hypothetical protein
VSRWRIGWGEEHNITRVIYQLEKEVLEATAKLEFELTAQLR